MHRFQKNFLLHRLVGMNLIIDLVVTPSMNIPINEAGWFNIYYADLYCLFKMNNATMIAFISSSGLLTIIGNAISGLIPATKPICLWKTKAALITFPLGSICFIRTSIKITWANEAIIPDVAVSLIPR